MRRTKQTLFDADIQNSNRRRNNILVLRFDDLFDPTSTQKADNTNDAFFGSSDMDKDKEWKIIEDVHNDLVPLWNFNSIEW